MIRFASHGKIPERSFLLRCKRYLKYIHSHRETVFLNGEKYIQSCGDYAPKIQRIFYKYLPFSSLETSIDFRQPA